MNAYVWFVLSVLVWVLVLGVLVWSIIKCNSANIIAVIACVAFVVLIICVAFVVLASGLFAFGTRIYSKNFILDLDYSCIVEVMGRMAVTPVVN